MTTDPTVMMPITSVSVAQCAGMKTSDGDPHIRIRSLDRMPKTAFPALLYVFLALVSSSQY